MNVPGQRKHPSQVQVQPQPQPRGSYHGYPQGPTPPVNYNRTGQPEGFENQSGRQIYRPQPPPQQYLQGFHQSGVPPHDMSKQSMSAQVPPPPGQTPPQATGVQMMYSNVTQQVPRNAGYVQQRQNMQGMGQRPPVPVAMMTTSNTVYNPQQMTTAVYLPPSIQQQTQFMTGQPQVLNYMTGPGGQMQMQYQAQMPPYTIQRAPQSAQYNAATYYQQQPTANNTPTPTPVYYPSQQQQLQQPATMVTTVQQPQQPQQASQQQPIQPQQPPQQQPTQQPRPVSTGTGVQLPYQKREKRGLAIVDPNTGRDITEDLRQGSSKSNTPPQSETSSARATPRPVTPPPSSNNDIAAQFAAQVAATLSSKVQPTQRQAQGVPPQVGSTNADMPEAEQSATPVPIQQSTADESTEVPATTAGDPKAMEVPEAVVNVGQSASELAAPKQVEPDQADFKPEPAARQLTPEAEERQPVAVTKKTPSPEKDAPTTKSVLEETTPKVAVASLTVAQIREPSPAKDTTVEHSAVYTKTVCENTDALSTAVSTKTRTETTKNLENESKPALSSQDVVPVESKSEVLVEKKMPDVVAAAEESRAKIPVTSEAEHKVKDMEGKEKDIKKKGRKKVRDLNEKGMKKVGSDMDAFTDQKELQSMATPTILPPVESNNVKVEKQDEPTKKETAVVTPVIEPVSEQKPPKAPEPKKQTPVAQVERAPVPQVERAPVPQVDRAPVPQVDRAPVPQVDRAPVPQVDRAPVPQVERTQVPLVERKQVPLVEKATMPAVEKATMPAVEKATMPAVEKATMPAVEKATMPAVEKATMPAVEKATMPAVEKATMPAVEITPAQTADKTPAPPVDMSRTVEIVVEDEKVDEANELNSEQKKEGNMNTATSNEKEEPKEEEPVPKKENKVELKYTYKEDQWSPLNPEGKMLYDRNFLLQLQYVAESVVKPAGLPKLPDVILDAPYTGRSGDYRGGSSSSPDFTPSFFRQPSSRDKPPNKRSSQQKRGGGGGGGGGGGMGNQPKVLQISLERDVQLHHTANAWKPPSHKGGNEGVEEQNIEELYRRVRAILNKLTPQKFQTLVKQCTSLEINTEERLKGSIDIIFEKALDEPSFSVAYASMCKYMLQLKVPVKDKPNEHVTFRALLLNRCQMEFERSKADDQRLEKIVKAIAEAKTPEEKKELENEKMSAYAKSKRRYLGNIRFIGELYKLKVLTEKIMHDCLMKLLRSNDEEDMECLCRLLTTIGKDIDHEKAKPVVDQYFQQIEKLIKAHRTSARVRFMLQDVVETRRNKWVPRRDDNNPKTIDQIHQEAQQQVQQQKQLQLQQKDQRPDQSKPTRGSGSRGGRGSSQMGGGNQQDDGWTAVGRMSRNIDPSRMKITKQNVDDNIQLGPGGRSGYGGWVHGSSGGGKTSSQEGERPSTPSNRFSALSGGASGADGYDRPRSSLGSRGMTPSRDGKGHYGQMPSRGKSGVRSSRDQERESALAAARHLTSGYGSNRTTPVGSRNQSREPSRNRDSSRNRDAPAADGETEKRMTAVAAPTEHATEYIEKKTKSLVDEYLQIHDLKEAVQCVKELESPKSIHLFVSTALNHVLERSSKARTATGTFLNHLVKHNLVSAEAYMKGLQETLEFAEDMQIDIPKIWQYLGELIGPMVQDGCLPLTSLRRVCEPLSSMAGVLVAEILHDMARTLGHLKVGELWRSSRLQWSDFVKPGENVDEFLVKHKLEFTQSEEEPRSPDGKSLPAGKIWDELNRLIVVQNVANEEVIDWIEANVGEAHVKEPAFIRALMTAICTSAITGEGTQCRVDEEKVKKRLVLLLKYLDHKETLELQALYALQTLVHQLEHPPSVLRTFFDTFYDEDIISEDAFNQWEESTDPAEQAGKGVAKTSVVQFFTWLHEAEEESQEDS